MLDNETKRRIDTARDILVGKVPDPKSQVEQITIALVYKFMDDMDKDSVDMGGKASFFTGEYERYAWSRIFDPHIGGFEMLNLYAEAIIKLNHNPGIPQLFRDIFKNAYLPYRDPETLKLFLKTINEFHYDHSEKLGDAFEYLLSVLGSQGDAGQFRTPRHIIDFMVQIVKPQKHEIILDPACGTAGFLISAYKHIVKENTKKVPGDQLLPDERKRLLTNFKGFDISPDMVRMSLVNMYLHGFVQPMIYEYDTLTSEDRWNEYADVILANPPFMSPKGGIKPHKRFSVQCKRSEVLFVDYIAEHLTPSGRAAVIVPEGIIFQSAGAYKQLRKMLVEKFLYAVVSLPAGVFNPYSGVKTSILLMDRQLARKVDSILFLKIGNDGFGLGAQRREMEGTDLPDVIQMIDEYVKAIRSESTESFNTDDQYTGALLITKARLAESEYTLTGDRYRITERKGHQRWPLVKLGEVCETSSGGTPLKSNPNYWENGSIPWLKSGEVSQGRIFQIEETITSLGLKESSAKMFPVDTVLVAMYGATAGQVGILKTPSSTNQAVCGILPNQSFYPDFLYRLLLSKRNDLIMQSTGGAQPNISQSIIRELLIPLPPIEVQQDIVAEIEGYQKIIDGARQVVENWKPQIEIDPAWPMVRLGDVCKINPTKSEVSSMDMTSTVSFLPMEDVGMVQDIYPVKERLLGEVYKGYTFFRENDVLIAKVTPCFENGKAGIPRNLKNAIGFGSSELHVIRPSETILPEFIFPFVSSQKFLAVGKTKMTGTGGLQRVPLSYFADHEIPLPSIEIQKEVVAMIEAERLSVCACRELIGVYEGKIKGVIDKVWGE
jgi:type I restriction enzyme M protein